MPTQTPSMDQPERNQYININGHLLDLNKPSVMGILNVTPDSFYSASRYMSEEGILNRVEQLVDAGVDLLDVGACSTRAGIRLVSEEEELRRLQLALHLIRKRWPDIPISVDTFRSNVVRSVYDAFGFILVNDISGGDMDPHMFETVAELHLPYVLTHIQGTPEVMQQNPVYQDLIKEVCVFFSQRLERLRALGVNDVILDPGFGFGKTLDHNYELLRRLSDFRLFDLPILVGLSRKSMIYHALSLSPDQSLNGTSALNMYALSHGANILRVHDVREAKECVTLHQLLQT